MGKKLSLSALISSLLATPLMAGPPARPAEVAGENPAVVNAAPAENPAELVPIDPAAFEEQLERLIQQQPLDAHGMQQVQRQMTAAMNDHLERVLAVQRELAKNPQLYEVQWTGGLDTAAPHTEKGAFLGVSTSPVTAVLREQLHLPPGMGLVVDYVAKDSPADAAGLKVHDILQKLDDQLLINPQQLAVLVRSKKPGDTLAIALVRGGAPLTLNAKLVEKDLPPLENLMEPGVFTNPGATPIVPLPGSGAGRQQEWLQTVPDGAGVPPGYSSSLSVHVNPDGSQTRTLADGQGNITLQTTADGKSTVTVKDRDGQVIYSGTGQDAAPDLAARIAALQKASSQVTVTNNAPGATASATASASRVDGDHEITVQNDNGNRTLTVKDLHTGQTLFNGPYHGAEDLKGLPEAVVKKVDALLEKASVSGISAPVPTDH